MIYAIGDSHTMMFCTNSVQVVYLGPATAYGLSNPNSQTGAGKAVEKFFSDHELAEDDVVLFVLGEIDCRIHLYRQSIVTGMPLSDLVATATNRYVEFVAGFIDRTKAKIILLGSPPCGVQDNNYNYDHYGSWDQRNEIYRLWNKWLSYNVMHHRLGYIDCYSMFGTEDGHARKEFDQDGVHLNQDAGKAIVSLINRSLYDSHPS